MSKISAFTPSPGIDNTSILAGLQTISGNVTDTKFTVAQVLSYIQQNQFPIRRDFRDRTGETGTSQMGTFSPVLDAVFQINSCITITAVSSSSILLRTDFFDIHGVLQSISLGSGGAIGFVQNSVYTIKVSGGTIINITALVTGSSITYDAFASMIQIA